MPGAAPICTSVREALSIADQFQAGLHSVQLERGQSRRRSEGQAVLYGNQRINGQKVGGRRHRLLGMISSRGRYLNSRRRRHRILRGGRRRWQEGRWPTHRRRGQMRRMKEGERASKSLCRLRRRGEVHNLLKLATVPQCCGEKEGAPAAS